MQTCLEIRLQMVSHLLSSSESVQQLWDIPIPCLPHVSWKCQWTWKLNPVLCMSVQSHTHADRPLLPFQDYILLKESWEWGVSIALSASAYGNQRPLLLVSSFSLLSTLFHDRKTHNKSTWKIWGPIPATSNSTANAGIKELGKSSIKYWISFYSEGDLSLFIHAMHWKIHVPKTTFKRIA